ncbi:hypothetical protein RchiOBHm_Chr1g0346271 [Rosa chinensis]|uniref:Uncharacterized protein n=1 Tax=Rosa chinensis TaxID=74649 RepID=A0A2P6SF03_ROSCH|nr:hypothetical protein RchiOBHm_Chr1g0346271 [Rosa chinensis]
MAKPLGAVDGLTIQMPDPERCESGGKQPLRKPIYIFVAVKSKYQFFKRGECSEILVQNLHTLCIHFFTAPDVK